MCSEPYNEVTAQKSKLAYLHRPHNIILLTEKEEKERDASKK